MDQHTSSKRRVLVDASVQAVAAATAHPTFPTGPNSAGVVVYPGDMKGARVVGARWTSTFTGFTAADATLQSSEDGDTWRDVKAFAQAASTGLTKELSFLDTDPKALRFWRLLVTMTGVPGTSTHSCWLFYDQHGARGEYAPPGIIDRAN